MITKNYVLKIAMYCILISFVISCKNAQAEELVEQSLVEVSIQNPILQGFYPDPSICKVGSDYYMVNSTFAYFPGIPIFHSRNLVDWEQISYALDRPEQLNLDGLGVSRGIFAPAIRHHNGVFYITSTLIDNGENFIISTRHIEGGWSNPTFIPEVKGIDPSLFIDEDGTAYILYNSVPPLDGEAYGGHRTLRMYEFDLNKGSVIGEEKIIVDKGSTNSVNPIWIEGPHIFKKDDFYYLIAAEGGTSDNHSEVVFRSNNVWGPYESNPSNPILTQRDLDPDRINPVTSTGHSDFITDDNGQWWSVFLGCRPYEDNHYNTGRETFMAPVIWGNGWPKVDLGGSLVKDTYPIYVGNALSENKRFKKRTYFYDDFKNDSLNLKWSFLRTPRTKWYDLGTSSVTIKTRPESCGTPTNPSFLGYRQEHKKGIVTTALDFTPRKENEHAGLIIFQNESHYYYVSKSLRDGNEVIVLNKSEGEKMKVLATKEIDEAGVLFLKIEAQGSTYDFYYSSDNINWNLIAQGVDATFLSTKTAGGFVGAFYGLYTTSLGSESTNSATFSWFENRNLDMNPIISK
ncbi:glycoside hydrolase family 43 protein [Dokdonia sp. Asnod1-B02]|uniref:glycoside hydrolase family 43 protein n=1 Tax=Dokdonia sp. Asnod1-B02 TaxID=3160573 RepID=UPI003866BC15